MNQTVRTIARGLLIIGPLLHLIGLGLGVNLEDLAVLGFLPMFLGLTALVWFAPDRHRKMPRIGFWGLTLCSLLAWGFTGVIRRTPNKAILIFLALALFVASEWRSRKAAERKDGTDRRSLALFIRRGSTKRSTCYEPTMSLRGAAMPAVRALRALTNVFAVANSKLEHYCRFQRVDRCHQLAAHNVGALQIGFNVDTLLVPGGGRNRSLLECSAATAIPEIPLLPRPSSESSVPCTVPEPRPRDESILKTRKMRQVLWLLLGYSVVAFLTVAAFVPRLHPKLLVMPRNGCGSCCYSNCLKQKRSLTPADAPSRPRRSD